MLESLAWRVDHDPLSALGHLVAETLMSSVFARKLPKLVALVREIFGADAAKTCVAHLEETYREGEKAARQAIADGDEEDAEPFDRPVEWVARH